MARESETLELLRSRLAAMEADQHSRAEGVPSPFWEGLAVGMPAPSRAADAGTAPASDGDNATAARQSKKEPKARQRARQIAPDTRPVQRGHGPFSDVPLERIHGAEQLGDLGRTQPSGQTAEQTSGRASERTGSGLGPGGFEAMVDDPDWLRAMDAYADHRAEQIARGTYTPTFEPDVGIQTDALLGAPLTRHHAPDLTRMAEWVTHQRASHEVTLLGILTELTARGEEPPEGLSRVDWLRAHDATLTAGQARAFTTVAAAFADTCTRADTSPTDAGTLGMSDTAGSRWARLRLLVTTGLVTVAKAAQIIDFHTRTAPVADPDDLTTALADLTEHATRLRPEELAQLVRHHTEQIRPPRDEDDGSRDRQRRDARGLWFTQPNATGMVGLKGTLDPEGAAIIKAAIDPLSAPAPETDEQGRTVRPDERPAARRRMDALLGIVQRGVAAAEGVPVTDKAKVVVLLDYETLAGQLTNGSGNAGGTGTTLTGDVLSPRTVRRMACDAEILPMVLGGDGELLDLGRSRRLFTRGQRLALIARDRGCSFPGCTVPATWCDAHHVLPWQHGGRTCVSNGALLCPRHHTTVHERDLTATVTARGVTWHT
ncbi:DUF222 domain-containing protein [Terrabacter sp. NPDC000476]|uniref:HNH endonuclease signature motif containing protein n=1 Tax=Terrabacter sp. NPDC000476 TaxID=3154258 RepID=UPI00331F0A66